MPSKGFKNLTLREDVLKLAEEFIKEYNKKAGYKKIRSIPHLIEEAIDLYRKEHKEVKE